MAGEDLAVLLKLLELLGRVCNGSRRRGGMQADADFEVIGGGGGERGREIQARSASRLMTRFDLSRMDADGAQQLAERQFSGEAGEFETLRRDAEDQTPG